MEVDGSTLVAVLTLAGGTIVVAGGWVISVEKRINGLKGLQKTVDETNTLVKTVDRRTERLSLFIRGRDVAHDPDPLAGV
jgi:hypothetical protein